jgi:hypothetical protein
MIICLHQGNLPALMCVSAELPAGQNPTLTEVACLAVYGAPLKPGTGEGMLRGQLTASRIEGRVLWSYENGPAWLRPHLELIAAGRSWPIAPDAASESEQITLKAFDATEKWLSHGRKLPAPEGTPADVAARKARLAEMSDAEAIAYALAEAERIERAERVVNARAARFYELLSEAVIAARIELKAIPVDPIDGSWKLSRPGRPPHVSVPPDYFNLPLAHNLYDNELDVHRHVSEQEAIDSVFNRIERANDAMLVRWTAVRIAREDAAWLLERDLFERVRHRELRPEEAEAEAARHGIGPLNPRPSPGELDPMREVRWTFAMALAWIVWRDPDKVRDYWERWRSERREWRVLRVPERSGEGATGSVEEVHLVPVQDRHGTSSTLGLDAAVCHARGDEPCVPLDEAEAALWRALQVGKLEPDGIDPTTGRRVSIPAREFLDLARCGPLKGMEYLDAGPNRYAYYEPTLRRAGVISEWPATGVDPDGLTESTFGSQAPSRSAKPSRRGRKKGQGSYEALDDALISRMHELLKSSPPQAASVEAAARAVAREAHGFGSVDSKVTRLARRYRLKYPSDFDLNKSD